MIYYPLSEFLLLRVKSQTLDAPMDVGVRGVKMSMERKKVLYMLYITCALFCFDCILNSAP